MVRSTINTKIACTCIEYSKIHRRMLICFSVHQHKLPFLNSFIPPIIKGPEIVRIYSNRLLAFIIGLVGKYVCNFFEGNIHKVGSEIVRGCLEQNY